MLYFVSKRRPATDPPILQMMTTIYMERTIGRTPSRMGHPAIAERAYSELPERCLLA